MCRNLSLLPGTNKINFSTARHKDGKVPLLNDELFFLFLSSELLCNKTEMLIYLKLLLLILEIVVEEWNNLLVA